MGSDRNPRISVGYRRASGVFPHGRVWSFGSFHKSENGILSSRAVASLGVRGEWAFRRSKSALPACQACGLDAPHVPAGLRSSSKMNILPRRDTFLGFPSGEQSGGPCCNCAFRPSKSAPLGNSERQRSRPWEIPKGTARVGGRFQMGRARSCVI